ncbi:MAG: NAD-dependent epimerase/dehydratase family protein [Anaerolineales bacterium]|nr:MAG: NAD-dependent epimerase/dehydratase family protein [Anaerolineales bacterium]
MKVLITGGAGFIGSHNTAALLNRGDQVVCLDNFNDYYNPERKRKNVSGFLDDIDYRLYEGDIRARERLEEVFAKEKPDKVIHVAAMAGVRPSIERPLLYEEVNVKGTLNMLEAARRHRVTNFLFASSSSVYGGQEKVPFSEDDPIAHPISPYAATKAAGELLCHTYHHLYGLNITCLRFFTVYGPKGRPDMAPYLFTRWVFEGAELKMFGDGTTSRDYTYIDDIVSGVVAALDADLSYEIINLGNSQTVVLRDFIALVEKLVGKKANIVQLPMQPGDVPRTWADISKARCLLGYDPQTPFEEGMKHFVAWYRQEVLAEQAELKLWGL